MLVCTNLFKEIVILEDKELLGIRFRNPIGFTGTNFEVTLFIIKRRDIVRWSEALPRKIFQ